MAFSPLANLSGIFPKFSPGGVSLIPVLRLRPWPSAAIPLARFTPANAGNLTYPGNRSFAPVNPLPGSSGGGGGEVGFPIDSG